ncbi:hypothetical protein MLD38_013846 [Melastoma candidum]|uniref:Uncharacterized protein n=1 Tax=Melastoma candidum TaxID=119954 RepID=A0ACB9RAW4_9MYRT|nr:hypothetical protein MLD38_013846 [Melastoma candidum]
MSSPSSDYLAGSSQARLLGLRLYIVLIAVFALCLTISFAIILLCIWMNRRSRLLRSRHPSGVIPLESKEIVEVRKVEGEKDVEKGEVRLRSLMKQAEVEEVVEFGCGKGKKSSGGSDKASSSGSRSGDVADFQGNIGWGRWYALKELEVATGGFSEENIIGEGGYGIVYRGVLEDGSVVAVKNLLNNKGQAEKEFKVEVEAIGKVRHKNLVGLLGYCAEGAQRMLVYEYVDNGNLEQWLHGDVGSTSPLTWEIRMKIAVGTAKGLAYLHEGLEPKVVHRDVKSSNILLDRKWNPKVSDFGLAKLLGSEATYVTTRVMGTFGYVSPEYASTGMLNEGSDVYSYGVLLMELITGRSPVDYARPAGEMNLVEWFKGMVANRRAEDIVDPLMKVPPPPRALKRVVLVCLRCIDLDAYKRPKMGQIIHMLEAGDFDFCRGQRMVREKDIPSVPEVER